MHDFLNLKKQMEKEQGVYWGNEMHSHPCFQDIWFH